MTGTDVTNSIDAQWARVRGKLRGEFGDAAFKSWLKPLTFKSSRNGVVYLSVSTRFMRDWVRSHYGDRLHELWRDEDEGIRGIEIVIESMAARPAETEDAASAMAVARGPAPRTRPSAAADGHGRTPDSYAPIDRTEMSAPLDPRFTFDKFVVGKPNELAYAAALRVAEAETVPFNPLFLYGSVGLGKTHLMHAIAWHIRQRDPARKVLYLSAEKFMYQFIRAVRFKDTMAFKEQFRSVDVLMIDDVQFICGKDVTQEEFFHTFNALVDQNRQVVISADKSPSDLEGMEERLRSRLGWGLVADIHPTTYELRLGILQAKAEQLGSSIPMKVMEFLAHKITSNVRELEGALNRIAAHATLVGRDDHARQHAGGAARPAARQRPAHHHRGDPEARRRALQHPHRPTCIRRGAPAPSPGRARSRCISPSS